MAKHISDFSKLPLEIVFDLINEQNGSVLNNTEVELGFPTIATGDGGAYNTDILVSSRVNSRYDGSVAVGYNRLDVEGFLFGEPIIIPLGDSVNFSDLIPEVNLKLRINLTPDDYVEGPIGEWQNTSGEIKQISIPMKSTSLVFIGSLPVTVNADDISLAQVFPNTVLVGLTYDGPG